MDEEELHANALLQVPDQQRHVYKRNFINQAVCELRFPTLFQIENDRPPLSFANALRKEYPLHTRQSNLRVPVGGGTVGQAVAHTFKDRREKWTVNLRTSTLSLETLKYDCFEEFRDRLKLVLDAAISVIDTEFFTRIGLRYINALPCKRDQVVDWLNPALAAPISTKVFSSPIEYQSRITGATSNGGGYNFIHGFGENSATRQFTYVLDYDFYREDVQADTVVQVLTELHDQEHQLFRWSLGKDAVDYLQEKAI